MLLLLSYQKASLEEQQLTNGPSLLLDTSSF